MLEILSKPDFPTLPNVWLGTQSKSEDYLDRIDLLRRVPARIRFVSFEPLLGPITDPDLSGIHWAIVGGESGPRARPMEAWWVEDLHETCEQQRVKFFFKQWGGKRKRKRQGRMLGDQTYDEIPKSFSSVGYKIDEARGALVASKHHLPKLYDYFCPTVSALKARGGSATIDELEQDVSEALHLSDDILAVPARR